MFFSLEGRVSSTDISKADKEVISSTDTVSTMSREIEQTIRRAAGVVRAALRERLAEIDLTPVQNTALRFVAAEPGSSSAELARRMSVTPQTMHKLVADLEQRGLLQLRPRTGHGRILDANLTEQGHRILDEADLLVDAVESQLTEILSGEQQRQIVELLERCIAALDPGEKRPPKHEPADSAS
jgi:DNA-binding MarR family transcriptional regulator